MSLPLTGSTVLNWRAVSDDGHPISGVAVFVFGERFSRIIPAPIAALIGSGLILGIVQPRWPGPTWLTPYGYILIAKPEQQTHVEVELVDKGVEARLMVIGSTATI